jgi:DNA-binding NtrC family response regulator
MVTAVRSVEQAVACMKVGAYDFLTKPWDGQELKAVLRRAAEKWKLTRDNQLFRGQQPDGRKMASSILGKSQAMNQVRERIAKIAAHDSTVLITGESGTGKELVAAAIHSQSSRATGRFVPLVCAAIPSELVESELFGHEKGAFSSAIAARVGKFEYASGGTLFLDDVATLPLETQAKLLRVLQQREVTRLGSNRLIPVDVRVISSTNQDLSELVKKGLFREDLYWRLCGVPLNLPPLRDRGDDIAELLGVFVERVSRRYGRNPPVISPDVYEVLKRHRFSGNVRELANLAETLVVLCEDDSIGVSSLPMQMLLNSDLPDSASVERVAYKDAMHEFERQLITRTLKAFNGNQSMTARQLGIHRNTLITKIQELGISKNVTIE